MKEGVWLTVIGLLFIIIALLVLLEYSKKRSEEGLAQQVIFDNRIYICKEAKQPFSNTNYQISCKPVY